MYNNYTDIYGSMVNEILIKDICNSYPFKYISQEIPCRKHTRRKTSLLVPDVNAKKYDGKRFVEQPTSKFKECPSVSVLEFKLIIQYGSLPCTCSTCRS